MRIKYIIYFLLFFSQIGFVEILPPNQPLNGVGGKNRCVYSKIIESQYGQNDKKYYIFEPADYTERNAPVVAFIHGWLGTNPETYRLWIEHIVKQGVIVIYPVYQRLITVADYFTVYSSDAVKDAIQTLRTRRKHIKPDLTKFAIVGHSAGGVVAINLATIASNDTMLPKPKFVLAVEPGRSINFETGITVIPLNDLRKIDYNVNIISVAGQEDINVYDYDAKKIYNETTNVPFNMKDLVYINSDYYGDYDLIADHYAPIALTDETLNRNKDMISRMERLSENINVGDPNLPGFLANLSSNIKIENYLHRFDNRTGVDALDFYGFWKLTDILIDIGFYNKNLDYLNNSDVERYMGTWSDGKQVNHATVID
jgi:dienelactone hydrolase